MKNLIPKIFLLIILTSFTIQNKIDCLTTLPKTLDEIQILEKVEKCVKGKDYHEINSKLMNYLIKRGFMKTADYLLKNYFLRENIDISQDIKKNIETYKRKLENLVKMISHVKKPLVSHPVAQWGQSYDKVFIHVKFSHRFDTPGCLDISKEKLEVSGRNVNFSAYCLQTHQPIIFKLNLDLFSELKSEGSILRKESVGTMVIELQKKEHIVWRRMFHSKRKPKNINTRIWWDMKDAFPKAMEEFSQLLEEDEDDDDDELWGFNKKKKKKEDEEKNEKETEDNVDL